MQRTSFGWAALLSPFLLASLGVAALVGCAEGSEVGYGESDLATLPVEAGDENSVVMLPPSSKPSEDEDAGTEPDAGNLDAGKKPDASPDGGGGGGGGGACASPNACGGATDLGSVSGDTGSGTKTATGSGSQWLKVRVTEDNNDLAGLSLILKADLKSPAGTNFDVHLYVGAAAGAVECSAVTKSSTSTGASDTATAEWGEGLIPNGSSDTRFVTVEVRHVSGTCTPTAKWSLTLSGNAN